MQVLRARNVCQALANTLEYLNTNAEFEDSRAGRVLVAPMPVCTVTTQPRERVLFSPIRDANPFFHLFEAIWMLAGSDNAKILDNFISQFSRDYAEPDNVLHGAYGNRWRYQFGFDQLDFVVQKFEAEPNTRQCVIQMWDAYKDRSNDLLGSWKDRPCNTTIFLRNNDGELDMTVCCRSNDMIWGAHGANAVHFSVLQEYLAARIDLGVGILYQISNNAHVYLEQYNKLISRASPKQLEDDRYLQGVAPVAMFNDPDKIDLDIHRFMTAYFKNDIDTEYYNEWFLTTLTPAMTAHYAYRKKDFKNALMFASTIRAPDWQVACSEWIERRVK